MSAATHCWVDNIQNQGLKIYSQGQQDGIIEYIMKNIEKTNPVPFCVEIGFDSNDLLGGGGANTANLILHHGWQALLLDGSHDNPAINLHAHFVTSNNICELFAKYNVPSCPEYISLDIDSCDLWVMEAILKKYTPAVMSVEFNLNIPVEHALTFPNTPSEEVWQFDRVFGASLKALCIVGQAHGYHLVFAGHIHRDTHHDAFFIHKSKLPANYMPKPLRHFAYTHVFFHPPCRTGRHTLMIDYEAYLEDPSDTQEQQSRALPAATRYLT